MENTEKSAAPTPTGGGGAKEKIEKQARQLAYDVRYKVRGALKAQSGGQSDPATVKKAYLAQLAKSPAVPAVKTRAKQMLVGEDYINLNKVVADGVASAMYKVFVDEHHQKDVDGNVIPHEEINEDETKEKTYKVRVTDKESGNSYVRNATRAKIAELRNNPNISSVEMTEYGEVTRSEKYKGSKTASVKSGKGVDYDGDGKVESGSKEHAGVVHNAIQKKKGGTPDGKDTRKENYTWKEAFSGLIEKKSEEEDKKLTGKGVNNKKLIKVFPDDVKEQTLSPAGAVAKKQIQKDAATDAKARRQGKPVDMSKYVDFPVKEDAEYGYDKEGNSLNPEDIKKKNEKDPNGKAKKEEDEDPRSIPTKMNLVKNKLRAMGLKVSHEPEGETIEEGEKLAQKAYKRAQELGAKRRKSKDPSGIYKSERAGYNLAQSQRSDNESSATQRGNQTGGGPKDYGFAKHKKNPVKSKSVGDTGRTGHAKKAQEKTSVGKSGKKLKTAKYKLSFDQRRDHHSDWSKRQELKDPKKNPKHTANVKSESVQSALDSLNTYYSKNEKLHGSLIHNEDAALEFVKKKIEREHGKGAYVSKDNPMKPQSAADKAKARAHQAKVDAENAAERRKDPSQGRYSRGY